MRRAALTRLLERSTSRVVLMDGGMGSTVEDRGVPVRNALWGSFALTTPEGLAVNDAVHADFVASGAEILIANTHNLLLSSCVEFHGDEGLGGSPEDLLDSLVRAAVASARRAVREGAEVAVAAGVGSPEGPYATESSLSPEEVARRLMPTVAAFERAGVDLVLFETLTTPSEIDAVARLARDAGLVAFGAGLTCGEDGRTLAGVTMADAVEMLLEAEPAALFVQCTGYDLVPRALDALAAALDGRAVAGVYANDGRVWRDMRWHGERVTPEEYAREAVRWRDAGARIVGGCCGTGPEHVAALARRLR
ncbi:MAG: homocysteine S-methyltransferase family protein [Planctomycetota bacterium]|jgi:homocysteine S-methyltransferase